MEAFETLIERIAPNLYAYRDRFFTSFAATFEMFGKAGLIAFVVGLFFGVLLVVTRKGGVRENLLVYQVVNIVINVFRSIPFIILLIFLIPLTRAVVGSAIGVKGAILPLVFGTVPFYTRQVEVALAGVNEGKVEAALSRILGQEIEISGSGRTDAGAHARMQVASFRAETGMDTSDILSRLREALPEDIAALELSIAEPRFHARLSCVGKTYIYRVQNSTVQNVFERKYMYRVSEALDIGAMQDAAKVLLGEHDFTAFQSNKRMKKSAVRRIDTIDITRIGDEIRFTVSGNGFLYNMVRIIVGTLLEAGAHRMSAEDVKRALESKVRENAGPTVPGQGLRLEEVRY